MQRLELIDGQADPARITLVDEILIGRGKEASLRIFDETASRRHAAIRFDGERVVIVDLDSTNGTIVNGEWITAPRVLSPGDKINIGGVILSFCHVARQVEADVDTDSETTVVFKRNPLEAGTGEGFRGDLTEIPVAAVLQVLAEGRKNGVLSIMAPDDTARCWFLDGRPVHAETGTQEGMAAALELCEFYEGRFVFFSDTTPPERSLDLSATELLIEASRRQDESLSPDRPRV